MPGKFAAQRPSLDARLPTRPPVMEYLLDMLEYVEYMRGSFLRKVPIKGGGALNEKS
jgi:hypothetical protein